MADSSNPTVAVIRRMTYGNDDDSRERMLKRQVPAWVISGGVHCVLIALGVLLFRNSTLVEAIESEAIIDTTIVVEEPEPNLEQVDIGLNANLDASVEATPEPVPVEGPDIPEEPLGSISGEEAIPIQTFTPPGSVDVMPNTGTKIGPNGDVRGCDGENGTIVAPGLKGRRGGSKADLLNRDGGNPVSEAAVAQGLVWLAAQQKADGRWVFDGSATEEVEAATGISLLPFLAAGQTHKVGKYSKNVQNGLTFLLSRQAADGRIGNRSMYAHAIATIALCEAYGMSNDPIVKKSAQRAIDWCCRAQHSAGGWRYSPGAPGDTSVTGWYYQALTSGKLAGLTVPDVVLTRAKNYFDRVQSNSGETYGYDGKDAGRHYSMNAVGLLCREYMGWGPKNPSIANGVARLIEARPPMVNDFDMYYYYYATQVVHFFGGPDWHQKWNPKMRDMLIGLQVKTAGPNKGSWDADNTLTGSHGGRVMTTCLALLTLEVYYRHLPLYKRDMGGLNELDQ